MPLSHAATKRAIVACIALAMVALVYAAAPARGAVTATKISSLNAEPSVAVDARFLKEAGGLLYFQAFAPTSTTLWRSDGTAAGTRKADFGLPVEPEPPFSAGGKLLMLGPDGPGQTTETLYVASGEPGTAVPLKSGMPAATLALDVVDGALLFTVPRQGGTDLWRSDGTVAGTTLVEEIGTSTASFIRNWKAVGDLLYFFSYAGSPLGTYRLWVSDGTAAGTLPISDPLSWPEFGTTFQMVEMGGVVYFHVSLTAGGIELWRSDGSAAGTAKVATVDQTVLDTPLVLAAGTTKLFFRHPTTQRMWVSDGTEAGTKEASTKTVAYTHTDIAVINDIAVFAANGTDPDGQLWRSDGTEDGTYPIGPVAGGNALWEPRGFQRVGNVVLFDGYPANGTRSIWQTDGTAAGTAIAAEYDPSPAAVWPGTYFVVGGRVVFRNPESSSRPELWAIPAAPFLPPTPTTPVPTVDPVQPVSYIPHAER